MGNIKESAKAYEPQTAKNVADLDRVSVDEDIKLFEGKDFSYNYIEREGERYRVPDSVLKQLKAQLDENDKIKAFKVRKDGEGMTGTSYTVIVLE